MISQSELFPACVKVLERQMKPMHYRVLTEVALMALGFRLEEVELGRVIEDVREKLLLAQRLGTFYVGSPHCLAALRRWFKTPELPLFHEEEIRIPGNAYAGALGAYEALMRGQFMLLKNPNANPIRINMTRARGQVTEQHVFRWALNRWPEFVMPAENDGHYHQWCDHDFRLEMGGRIIKVDVAGPRLDEDTYGTPRYGTKRSTDLHLLACIDNKSGDVVLQGVQRGTEFGERIIPAQAASPVPLLVWLDCLREGLPYGELAKAITHRRSA